MALWMGNDINMSVSNYSYKAASFWSSIMGRVCQDLPRASYFEMPGNVTRIGGEYYTQGTYSKVVKKKTKTKKSTEKTTTTIQAPITAPPATAPPTTAPTTAPTVAPTTESTAPVTP